MKKIIALVSLGILLFLPMIFASELTITSVSPVNIIKSGDYVSGEILVDTKINVGGQSFIATLNPQDVRNFEDYGSENPYPANSITIEVNNFEEYVFYNFIQTDEDDVYKYQSWSEHCDGSGFLDGCKGDAPSCPIGAKEFYDKTSGGKIRERVCIAKEQSALLGNFRGHSVKFNADIKVSSGTKVQLKTISSKADGVSSIDLGEAGTAKWVGSSVSGDSVPYVDDKMTLLKSGTSNWKVVSKTKKSNYDSLRSFLEQFLGEVDDLEFSKSELSDRKITLNNRLENSNAAADSLINDQVSLDYSYNKENGQDGILIKLTSRVTLPEILFTLKASWIGVVIPSGMPEILSVKTDKFESGKAGNIELKVKNIGEAKGVFSVRLVGCEPFIVPTTSASMRTEVQKGGSETIKIPISGGDLSKDLSKTCSIEVYDINEPSHKDSASLTLELGSAKFKPSEIPQCRQDSQCADNEVCSSGKCNKAFTIVVVPLGISEEVENNYYGYSKKEMEFFRDISPLDDSNLRVHYIDPSICNPVTQCTYMNDLVCDEEVIKCATKSGLIGVADKLAAIVDNNIGVGGFAGIDDFISISKLGSDGTPSHEIGHNLGLYHINPEESIPTILCSTPDFACTGPNAEDCKDLNAHKDVMSYCAFADHYGHNAYSHMKEKYFSSFIL